MSETTGVAMRRVLMAAACSAMPAVVAFVPASAADLSVPPEHPVVAACPPPQEVVILYDEDGRPTVPGRTEYYFCVTGTVLRPGDIPPPPEYCCG